MGPPSIERHGALFARASTPVYRELIRLCGGDRNRADDLRQATFERAARHLDRHPDTIVDVGWCVTVARSAFLDQARSMRREQRFWDRVVTLADFRRHEAQEPDWDAVSSGDALVLLGQLNDAQRAALVLHHLHDLPVAEVATQIGRSVRATESLLVRARSRLRTLVEEIQ